MASQLIDEINRTVPMHEQALLEQLSNYHKQLMSIDRRVIIAHFNPNDTKVSLISKRLRTKRSKRRPPRYKIGKSLSAATKGSGVTKARAKSKRAKSKPSTIETKRRTLSMQELREITSALCELHIILTHLVGIEMTENTSLRCQAESLEDIASQTVDELKSLDLYVDERDTALKEVSGFVKVVKHVSTILRRRGHNSESQERRKRRLEKRNLGCDELTQALGKLSMEHKAVEDKTAIILYDS